jgi:Na+/H+-dicarboxylate symporter
MSENTPPSKTEPRKRLQFWFRIPIYKRISFAMVAGLVVGIVFGPQSPLLEQDRLRITAKKGVVPYVAADPDAKQIATRLDTFSEVTLLAERQTDDHTWYRIRFVSRQGQKAETGWVKATAVSQPYASTGETVVSYLRPVGKIFLRLIKMLVVPLVFFSLLVGVFSLSDMRKLGRLGGKTLIYYTATTAVAILIGLGLANLIKPGSHVDTKQRQSLVAGYESEASQKKEAGADKDTSVISRIVRIVPENPFQAAAEGDILQIIFFALFLGIILRQLPGTGGENLVSLCSTINDALVKAVVVVMETAPFGVFALLADVVGSSGYAVLLSLGVYCAVVVAGLLVHMVGTYSLALKLFSKVNPVTFLKAARPAQLMGFSTSSSAATLPVTLRCAEETLGVSKPVSSFILPLGATVNMDGTALYQAVAAVFVAQVFGIPMGLEQQLAVLLTAVLASVGAAAVPGAGIIMLAMILESAGLPDAGIALVLGVDRLLDMLRTAVNVTGDLSAAVVVAASEGESVGVAPRSSAVDSSFAPSDSPPPASDEG